MRPSIPVDSDLRPEHWRLDLHFASCCSRQGWTFPTLPVQRAGCRRYHWLRSRIGACCEGCRGASARVPVRLQFSDLRFDLLVLAQQARSPIGAAVFNLEPVSVSPAGRHCRQCEKRLISIFGGSALLLVRSRRQRRSVRVSDCEIKGETNHSRRELAIVVYEDNVFRFRSDLLLMETFRIPGDVLD